MRDDNLIASFDHVPVLPKAVLRYLQPQPGDVIVDATVGGGGHSSLICKHIGPTGTLIGIDQDERALAAADMQLAQCPGNVKLVRSNFTGLEDILKNECISGVDGILFDFGVSSPQLDEAERGFSYNTAAPLDMRMDQSQPVTAATLVNTLPAQQLRRIISEYGEERWSHRIAMAIVANREQGPIETTDELAHIVKAAIPAAARRQGPHPARRTFQALRIAVNRELDVIQDVLPQAIRCLNDGGRLVAISFHSLEDRLVKQAFRTAESPCQCPPRWPVCTCGREPTLKILTRQPIVADDTELELNPRARSAKLRAAERVLLREKGE